MEESVNLFLSKANHQNDSELAANDAEWNELARGQHIMDYKPSQPSASDPQHTERDRPFHLRNIICPSCLEVKDISPAVGTANTSYTGNSTQVGVCGLRNNGNTCYMNAGLQCVRSVAKIASFFLGDSAASNDKPVQDNKVVLSKVFREIVRKLWSGQFPSIDISYFKNTFDLVHPQFKGNRQQDSQEFLAMLLDTLHEEHKSTSNLSVISETFQGQLLNEVVCVQCNHKSIKKEPFVYLSLPLPGAHLREIEFFWVPLPTHQVMKITVQVAKNEFVTGIKTALCQLIGRHLPKDLMMLAEIKNHSIRQFLGDNFLVKDISFKNEQVLYMYELHPVNELASTLLKEDPWSSPKTTESVHDVKLQEGLDAFGSEQFNDASPKINEATSTNCEATPTLSSVLVKWHTCSVCLEEMVDSDLLLHGECGGMICSSCLQGSVEHYNSSNEEIPCPICSVSVSAKDSFVPLATETDITNVLSFMQVTVLFRKASGELFAHPKLVSLPVECSGGQYYYLIEAVLPPLPVCVQWKLCLTGFNGKVCSRCDYSKQCSGCSIERSIGSILTLKPGDHLTVQLLTDSSLNQFEHMTEHCSSLTDELNHPLTLNKCLEAFSKSESLDADNPWYCPSCKQNCSAIRTLTVHSLPNTLIVHLKRFSYQMTTGMKLDIAVDFPMELDASIISAHFQSKLQLIACVCHYGTLQCGHYTAYVKHPVTKEWIYYNDSLVSKNEPTLKDMANVYVLFYQLESCDVCQLPSVVSSEVFDDQVTPPLPLKRSSSDLNISKLADADLISAEKKPLSVMSPW